MLGTLHALADWAGTLSSLLLFLALFLAVGGAFYGFRKRLLEDPMKASKIATSSTVGEKHRHGLAKTNETMQPIFRRGRWVCLGLGLAAGAVWLVALLL